MHKHFRLLIGTGVVTVFVLTGTIYGFTLRLAGSQRLKTSQTLIEQKNSEDCDVRLQKCDAGVDWQNVDVKRFSEHLGPVWSVAIVPMVRLLLAGVVSTVSGICPPGSCSTYIWSFRLDLCHCD